jgi:anti-sigma regulatory factor (Ser/Thr protein kinase)
MIEISRSRDCARQARHAVALGLAEFASADRLDDMMLVASELVTNAYRHGEGKIQLRLAVVEGQASVEVVDEGPPGRIKLLEREPDQGGWGLRLVDELASEWGVYEGSTHVWAMLPLV